MTIRYFKEYRWYVNFIEFTNYMYIYNNDFLGILSVEAEVLYATYVRITISSFWKNCQ